MRPPLAVDLGGSLFLDHGHPLAQLLQLGRRAALRPRILAHVAIRPSNSVAHLARRGPRAPARAC